MKPICPNSNCSSHTLIRPNFSPIIRNGTFFRQSDSRKISRFYCKLCGRYFSRSTFHPAYFQKCRRITHPLRMLLASGVTQRRSALLLGVSRSTIERRFRYLGSMARGDFPKSLEHYKTRPLSEVEFDDLETHEHTKCKPLSVTLAVEPGTRKILGFQVSRMPAKGHLSKISVKKYGPRKDERSKGWSALFNEIKPLIQMNAVLRSDDNPHYPKYVRRHFPLATHETVKGGRGAITGQGELKKLKFDPIFSLNHTCAMFRANMNRLFRRTWSTTKTIQGLIDHISIYAAFHNEVLTKQPPGTSRLRGQLGINSLLPTPHQSTSLKPQR